MAAQLPLSSTSARRAPCPAPACHARAGLQQPAAPSCSGRGAWEPAPQQLRPARALRAAGGSRSSAAACRAAGRPVVLSAGDIVEVEELKGIRVSPGEDPRRPVVEYLVQWKDGSPDTWEPASNLADNLLRDYEQMWWGAVRKGEEEKIYKMLAGGGKVLARTLDENRRSALHFAAALGKADLVAALVHNGADVDLGDKDGYTPLHMAAGYLHTTTVTALIQAGADPEQEDATGRSPMGLVENLKDRIPANNPSMVTRRIALEEVIKCLTDNLYEDVEPAAVLDSRVNEEEGGVREFLVRWQDDREESWLAEKYLSQEVVEDYESGLEYAEAECVLGVKIRGDSRTYRVRWQDGYPDSWEPEEHVSPDLIALFEQQQALLGEPLEHQGQGNGSSAVSAATAAAGQQQPAGSSGSGEGRVLQAAASS